MTKVNRRTCTDCEFSAIKNTNENKEEDWYCEKEQEMIEYSVEFMDEPSTPDWCPLSFGVDTQIQDSKLNKTGTLSKNKDTRTEHQMQIAVQYTFDDLMQDCKPNRVGVSNKHKDPRSEHQIQSAFINLCFKAKTKYPCLEWIHAIPNGGARDQIVGKKLKDEGVKSGVLDIFLPVPNTKYHGLYIEFKAGRNTLSFEQIRFKAFVESQGYLVGVFYNEGKAFDFLVKYLEE